MKREDFMKLVATGAITPVIASAAGCSKTKSPEKSEPESLVTSSNNSNIQQVVTAENAFDSIAALKKAELDTAQINATSSSPNKCVQVLGYYEPGDGGGGLFYWDSQSTEIDNEGTIIEPAIKGFSGTGRWKRIIEGSINVKWFGAIGDDDVNSAVSNTARIQGAIDYAYNKEKNVIVPSGTYYVTNSFTVPTSLVGNGGFDACLNIPSTIKIHGEGKGSTIIKTNNIDDTIFGSTDIYVASIEISNMSLVGNNRKPGSGCGIRIGHYIGEAGTNNQIFYSSELKNLSISKFSLNLIRTGNEFANRYINITGGNALGHQLYIEGSTNTILESCYIKQVPTKNRAAYRLLDGGQINSCNGTESGNPIDHYWLWIGNNNGKEPEETDLGERYYTGVINNCNFEHYVKHACRIDGVGSKPIFNSPKFRQNTGPNGEVIKGNIIVSGPTQTNLNAKLYGVTQGPVTDPRNGADIRVYREANIISDSALKIYSTDYNSTSKAGIIYGLADKTTPDGFLGTDNFKASGLSIHNKLSTLIQKNQNDDFTTRGFLGYDINTSKIFNNFNIDVPIYLFELSGKSTNGMLLSLFEIEIMAGKEDSSGGIFLEKKKLYVNAYASLKKAAYSKEEIISRKDFTSQESNPVATSYKINWNNDKKYNLFNLQLNFEKTGYLTSVVNVFKINIQGSFWRKGKNIDFNWLI